MTSKEVRIQLNQNAQQLRSVDRCSQLELVLRWNGKFNSY